MEKQIQTYPDWKAQTIDVVFMQLDPENYRLDDDVVNQAEIINDLFENENAYEIATSIVDSGWLPDESVVVVYEGKTVWVLEGNRRVAALKAILNPDILVGRYKRRIRALIDGIDTRNIKSIEVRVAPSRELAQSFLVSKHGKNTRRPWSTLRRANFFYSQLDSGIKVEELIQKYPNHDVASYISMYEMHRIALSLPNLSDEQIAILANRKKFNFTNYQRLYQDPYFKQKMRIEIDGVTGEVCAPINDRVFQDTLARFLDDILFGRVTSRNRLNTAETRKQYIDDCFSNIAPSSSKKAVDISKTARRHAATTVQPRIVQISPISKLTLRLSCPYPDNASIQQQIDEYNRLDKNKFPYAGFLLLRNILELSMAIYVSNILKEPDQCGSFGRLISSLEKAAKRKPSKLPKDAIRQLKNNRFLSEGVKHNPSLAVYSSDIQAFHQNVVSLIAVLFSEYKRLKSGE